MIIDGVPPSDFLTDLEENKNPSVSILLKING